MVFDYMQFPKLGVEYSPEQILKICEFRKWDNLADRIRSNLNKLKSFKSDGCSLWIDSFEGKSFLRCCIHHDIEYWVGGTDDDRYIADWELAICVTKKIGHKMAEEMLLGIRSGYYISRVGNFSWEWGYGLKYV